MRPRLASIESSRISKVSSIPWHFFAAGLLCLLLATPPVIANDKPSTSAPTNSEELLRFLIREIDAAKDRVHTASYVVKWDGENISAEGVRSTKAMSASVWRDGEKRFSVFDTDTHVTGKTFPKEGVLQQTTYRLLINEQYTAVWIVGNSLASVYDHLSIDRRSDEENDIIQTSSLRDVLRYGFGDGDGSLGSAYQRLADRKWSVEERKNANAKLEYHVEVRSADADSHSPPYREYVIEPDKGFLITYFAIRTPEGDLGMERKVLDAQALGDGVWMPTSIEDITYARWKRERRASLHANENPIMSRSMIRLTDVHVGEKIPDDRFDIDRLLIPAEIIILRKDVRQRVTPWRLVDGKLVPQDIADSFKHEVRAKASANPAAEKIEQTRTTRVDAGVVPTSRSRGLAIMATVTLALGLSAYLLYRWRARHQL
jgi:hypothetical protein